jgi:hypothetical protein
VPVFRRFFAHVARAFEFFVFVFKSTISIEETQRALESNEKEEV